MGRVLRSSIDCETPDADVFDNGSVYSALLHLVQVREKRRTQTSQQLPHRPPISPLRPFHRRRFHCYQRRHLPFRLLFPLHYSAHRSLHWQFLKKFPEIRIILSRWATGAAGLGACECRAVAGEHLCERLSFPNAEVQGPVQNSRKHAADVRVDDQGADGRDEGQKLGVHCAHKETAAELQRFCGFPKTAFQHVRQNVLARPNNQEKIIKSLVFAEFERIQFAEAVGGQVQAKRQKY